MTVYMVECVSTRRLFARRYDAERWADSRRFDGFRAMVFPILVDGEPEPSVELEALRAEVAKLRKLCGEVAEMMYDACSKEWGEWHDKVEECRAAAKGEKT